MSRYPNGQPVRVSTITADLGGTVSNATGLTLTVKLAQADGSLLTTGTYASPVNDSTGKYHQDVPAADLTANGHYQYSWTVTGSVVPAPSFGDFDVFDPFETAVLPLADGKDALNIPQATTTYDSEIQAYVASIQSCLERMTGGPLVNRSITERSEMQSYQTVIPVRLRPLVSVTSIVSASGGTIDISAGLDLDVNAGLIRRKLGLPFYGPFFQWLPQVNVTYVAGWGTSVPAAFNTAARIILQNLWQTQHGPSARPAMGAGTEMVTWPGFGFAIPNQAAELLEGSQNGVPFMIEAYV